MDSSNDNQVFYFTFSSTWSHSSSPLFQVILCYQKLNHQWYALITNKQVINITPINNTIKETRDGERKQIFQFVCFGVMIASMISRSVQKEKRMIISRTNSILYAWGKKKNTARNVFLSRVIAFFFLPLKTVFLSNWKLT